MHAIAARDGAATNWSAFRASLDKALKAQHAILWPNDPSSATACKSHPDRK